MLAGLFLGTPFFLLVQCRNISNKVIGMVINIWSVLVGYIKLKESIFISKYKKGCPQEVVAAEPPHAEVEEYPKIGQLFLIASVA